MMVDHCRRCSDSVAAERSWMSVVLFPHHDPCRRGRGLSVSLGQSTFVPRRKQASLERGLDLSELL